MASGLAHGVITEDSDLAVFLSAAETKGDLILKMDDVGSAKMLKIDNPSAWADDPEMSKASFIRGFKGFTPRMFVQMCVLAG